MNICFVCETPYHLMTCINYAMNNMKSDFESNSLCADIYLSINYGLYDKYAANVAAEGIFSNVYSFNRESGKNKLDKLAKMVKQAARPTATVIKCSSVGTEITSKKYDYIYMACVTTFTLTMALCCKSAKVRFFDDGIGTYIDSVPFYSYFKSSMVFNIRGRRAPWKDIDNLYVNNAKFCKSTFSQNVIQLALLGDSNNKATSVLKRVFGYKADNAYDDREYIMLTQPHDNDPAIKDDSVNDTDLILFKYLEPVASKTILRTHPRQNLDAVSSLDQDKVRNMWEIMCLDVTNSDVVLISEFSTAQMTPFMLYKLEPWIVFTYKLYPNDFSPKAVKQIENMIAAVKSSYSDSSKIVCIESASELEKFISARISGE